MAEIQIARIDYRLIHGQVVTKWMKAYPAKRIVIVDTELAQDDFMSDGRAGRNESGCGGDRPGKKFFGRNERECVFTV